MLKIKKKCVFSFLLLENYNRKYQAGNCMFRVGHGDAGAVCEVFSGLAMKKPGRRHWRHAGVFIVGFGRGWSFVLVFLLLNLGKQMPAGY